MPAIGIDLGTTNSCVAVYRNDRIEIIANDEGSRVTPSFVSFTEHERLVGEAAKREASFNFENSLFQIKRLMGRTYNDPIVQSDMKLWGFKVIDADNKPTIQVTFRSKPHELCPEEVSGLILEYLKKTAEDFLGEPVTDAVITVPAYFNDAQRSATRDAGTIAGLNVLRMVNEPTAAAIAYGLDREKAEEQNVLIFDLGGGTFDVTVVRIKDKTFEVRATGGDTHLGGDDFDNNMVKHFVKDFNSKNKCDMSKNKRGINRLRVACEAAKRKLSVSTNATVEVDGLHNGIDYKSKITRTEFERLNYEIFAQTIQTVEKVLEDAKIGTGEIDNIVLVGGSTRIPKIRKLIEDNFEDTKISRTINPDEAVAYGAAVLAAKVSPEDMPKLDNMNLHDVAPLSLGWRNARGDMVTVVRRNSRIPIEKWSRSTTAEDYQTSVTMSIYEGERPAAKDNNHLGSFKLDDIPSARRGVEKFEICFRVDENGILTVSERIVSTGKHNQTTIGNKGRLTPEQVSDIAQQANQFRKEDAAWKERSKRRHKLENYVYFVKHSAESEEFNGKISSKNKEEIRDKCSEIVSWLKEIENPEIEDSEQKQEELEQTCLPIFAMLPGGSKILEKLANFE